ncbi:MAG: glycerol kinase [Gemmatales bacterium]|nr:MAG: glycerol kinase [Gemmatales bacterium]
MTNDYVLAIDQGTTSTRAFVFDPTGQVRSNAAVEIKQYYPKPGWVEHDADEIWQSVVSVVKEALANSAIAAEEIRAIGVTNQRETTLLWDRKTGAPAARAIVWQDRRTAEFCKRHRHEEAWLQERSGLVLDPYFSATKLSWLLENDAELKGKAVNGDLAFGTVDSFLIWRLTGGKVHATDLTNASRTLLLNLKTGEWDAELCRYFGVPERLLPEVRFSAADFGTTAGLDFLPDGVPICGVAGDQQAALVGQFGFTEGSAKCTYGTGAFFLVHTGERPILSQHRLVSSLAASKAGAKQYVLEGSIFVAGAAVQWLRDGLHLIDKSADIERLAASGDSEQEVYLVPAFVGLGAPYWSPDARGAVFGLTRAATSAELARAALEGVAFQVADLVEAAAQDMGCSLENLRADGGMAANAWFLQRQADILGIPVLQASQNEATAFGAAILAGWQAGVWSDLEQIERLERPGRRFEPHWPEDRRSRKRQRWRQLVQAVISLGS